MICLAFAASLVAQRQLDEPHGPRPARPGQCQRIVSMAPSITETLFSLGLGDRVVGVSRDSRYPAEVERIKAGGGDVGGYFDPNVEAIVARKPDLVVMLEESAESQPGMAKLDLRTLVVCHKTVEGIIESFGTIGRACDKEAEGRQMQQDFRNRLARVQSRVGNAPRPRVLVAVDRTFDTGHLADVYIAGVDDYFDTIVRLAGGENVYRQPGIRYPVVSPEGIIRLNPDVIVELVPSDAMERHGRQAILDAWKDVGAVAAVKNHRIMVFAEDYALVPGPRFIRLVEELAQTLRDDARAKSL
ncbi:MAG: helical backbone metal receptor [Thermoguttaceae bacterium]